MTERRAPATEAAVPAVVHQVLRRPGRPLDAAVATTMGQRLGADVSGALVHTDELAGRSAAALGADAWSAGRHLVFGAGQYAPAAPAGVGVLAHELSHYLQRGGARVSLGAPSSLTLGSAHAGHEAEADAMAGAVTAGRTAPAARFALSPGVVARKARRTPPEAAKEEADLNPDDLRVEVSPVAVSAVPRGAGLGPRLADEAIPEAVAALEKATVREVTSESGETAQAFSPAGIVDELGRHRGDIDRIVAAYDERHPPGLRAWLVALRQVTFDHTAQQDCVRALALLYDGQGFDLYAQLGLALIPSGTRDEELDRLMTQYPLAARRLVTVPYEKAFRGIGLTPNDTLLEHLNDDLRTYSPELYYKYAVLLDRELLPVDKLYIATKGQNVSTNAITALGILRGEWERGLDTFAKLIADWDEYVVRIGNSSLGLRAAMRSEKFIGEWTDLVEALFEGHELKLFLLGQINTSAWEGDDADVGRRVAFALEAADIAVAEASLDAATTGGLTGLGTNYDEVFAALRRLRTVWEQRIARTRKQGPAELVATYLDTWRRRQAQITRRLSRGVLTELADPRNADDERRGLGRFLITPYGDLAAPPTPASAAEVETPWWDVAPELGNDKLTRAKLELRGELSQADKLWLAGQDHDSEGVLGLITSAWLAGEEEKLVSDAKNPPEGSVRPAFYAEEAIRQADYQLVRKAAVTLAPGLEHWERGLGRLELELEHAGATTAASALAGTLKFLSSMSDEQLDRLSVDFAIAHGIPPAGKNPRTPLLGYIWSRQAGFELSLPLVDLSRLLEGRAVSLDELYTRALERNRRVTGTLDFVVNPVLEVAGQLTGEDSLGVARESLERLRRLAEEDGLDADDLVAIAQSVGAKSPFDVGVLEYGLFKQRLDEVRSLRRSLADALETVVSVGGRSLLILALGPAGLPGLVAALGSFMAGMLVKELVLDTENQLFSVENLATLLEEVATFGFDVLKFEAVIAETFPAETVAKLLRLKSTTNPDRYAKFVQESIKSAGSKLVEKATSNALLGRSLPSSEELAARAVTFLTLGTFKGLTLPIAQSLTIFTERAERFRKNFFVILFSGPPAKAALPTVIAKEFVALTQLPGFADMTGPEIAARLTRAGVTSVASAVTVSATLAHVGQADAIKARRLAAENPSDIDDLIRSDPKLGPAYRNYAAVVVKKGGRPPAPHEWAQLIDTIEVVQTRKLTPAEEAEVRINRKADLAAVNVAASRPDVTETVQVKAALLLQNVYKTSAALPRGPLPPDRARSQNLSRALRGDPEELEVVLNQHGRWEDAITSLRTGTGPLAHLAEPSRLTLVGALKAHRADIVAELDLLVGARAKSSASDDAISDQDLNVKDGASLLRAEEYMAGRYGEHWKARYRMDVLVDPARLGTYENELAKLSQADRAKLRLEVNVEFDTLLLAQRVRQTAPGRPLQNLLRDLPPGVDIERVRKLAELDEPSRLAQRDAALLQADADALALRGTKDERERLALARSVTVSQMRANAAGDSAYIATATTQRFVENARLADAPGRYQAALEQVAKIEHAVYDAGGVLAAARSYEPYKYVFRLATVLDEARIADRQLAFFRHWGELAYQVHRRATAAADRPRGIPASELGTKAARAGVRYSDLDVATKAPSDAFLVENYDRMLTFARRNVIRLQDQAQARRPGPAQTALLSEFFGNSIDGAKDRQANFAVPAGLSIESLLWYRATALDALATAAKSSRKATFVQSTRLDLADRALKQLGWS